MYAFTYKKCGAHMCYPNPVYSGITISNIIPSTPTEYINVWTANEEPPPISKMIFVIVVLPLFLGCCCCLPFVCLLHYRGLQKLKSQTYQAGQSPTTKVSPRPTSVPTSQSLVHTSTELKSGYVPTVNMLP